MKGLFVKNVLKRKKGKIGLEVKMQTEPNGDTFTDLIKNAPKGKELAVVGQQPTLKDVSFLGIKIIRDGEPVFYPVYSEEYKVLKEVRRINDKQFFKKNEVDL